jgi:5-methylcytosine-specific restriction endonuclease McrA
MTTNIDTQTMSSRQESGPERTLTGDEDEPHFIFERDGFQCQVCGEIGHPHELEDGLMLSFPPYPDGQPRNHIALCGECWLNHTEEQLDEYVAEMQEQQRALEEDPGDYGENRERAFERDDHTCQLCGQEGYPKTERGLVAYPVRAGDFHLDNLVTVCNDCITDTLDSDEEEQKAADRLRIRAAKAKEWVNADGPDAEQAESINGYW